MDTFDTAAFKSSFARMVNVSAGQVTVRLFALSSAANETRRSRVLVASIIVEASVAYLDSGLAAAGASFLNALTLEDLERELGMPVLEAKPATVVSKDDPQRQSRGGGGGPSTYVLAAAGAAVLLVGFLLYRRV